MAELTLMESSFSWFHCFWSIFFSRQNKGTSQLLMHSSQKPIMPRKTGILAISLQLWKWSHPMGFFIFLQDFPEVCYHFYPSHLPLTALESSWAQTPAQEGWTQVLQECQCTVQVLMSNNSMCHKAWNILWLKADFSENPPKTWTARGYLGCNPVFHQALYVATKWMEVLELLFWSWYCTLLLDFACAKQQCNYLFGSILGGSTGSTYILLCLKQ